jgi:hypothetical protein
MQCALTHTKKLCPGKTANQTYKFGKHCTYFTNYVKIISATIYFETKFWLLNLELSEHLKVNTAALKWRAFARWWNFINVVLNFEVSTKLRIS